MAEERHKIERAARGEATTRVVTALANESPRVHSRQTFLESKSLAQQFGKSKLNENEKNAVAKTLGRLIANEVIGETLYIRRTGTFSGEGLVGVSVSLTCLQEKRDKWSGPEKDAPTQELIALEILKRSASWVDKKRRQQADEEQPSKSADTSSMDPYRVVPLIVREISIVHGSASFDLLVSVRYRHPDEFLEYVREVVQRVPCVESTQTMQVRWLDFHDEPDASTG